MNFTTDLPKQDPIGSYLVATGKIEDECYRMHVVVNSQEYSKDYRKPETLRRLKAEQIAYEKSHKDCTQRQKEIYKLLEEDRDANSERIILCHVMKINSNHDDDDDRILLTKRDSKMRKK
jgi:hypothetical protein